MDEFIFKESLAGNDPPELVSIYLKALWYDAKENWEAAHHVIQDLPDKHACSIHAYLHRKEGDISNAVYWYGRAGIKRPDLSLKEEWQALMRSFINLNEEK